jgi:hypothetical protein
MRSLDLLAGPGLFFPVTYDWVFQCPLCLASDWIGIAPGHGLADSAI